MSIKFTNDWDGFINVAAELFKVLGMEPELEVVEEDYFDPFLQVDNVMVCYCEEAAEREVMGGAVILRRPGKVWVLGYEIYSPGVRYYPDGSGEPPSGDFHEVATYQSAALAASNFVQMVAGRIVADRFEAMMEDMMRQQADDERFLEENYDGESDV